MFPAATLLEKVRGLQLTHDQVFCGQRVGLPWPLEVALLADRAPNHYIKELSMMMAREARNEAQGVRRVVFYEQI